MSIKKEQERKKIEENLKNDDLQLAILNKSYLSCTVKIKKKDQPSSF